jgi:hypothetical protein
VHENRALCRYVHAFLKIGQPRRPSPSQTPAPNRGWRRLATICPLQRWLVAHGHSPSRFYAPWVFFCQEMHMILLWIGLVAIIQGLLSLFCY